MEELSPIVNSQEEYDRFVREVVGATYDAMMADPTRGIPLDQVQQEIAQWECEDALDSEQTLEGLKRTA